MSPRLVLQFLGLPQILLDNQPLVTDRRKALALLAYLAVDGIEHPGQKYSRESLSALFWPDYEQAKAFSNLRRTIWEVNQALGEGWLIADRESVQLNEDADIDLDVVRFLTLLSQARQQFDSSLRIPLLTDAAKLYRNHFLTGFSLRDAYPFNEWAYAESEELRHQLADALDLLVESHFILNQAEAAIPHARRLVSLEPLNEAAHRQLMEVYLQAGQHSAALKQYQTCEQLLRKELNLDPQPETRALYKKMRKRGGKPVQAIEQTEIVTPRHNLPFQISTFIGREKECDEIRSLLKKNRLVTLAGIGGIGKTRLALRVGEKFLTDYPDGVWFIPFDSLSNPALVPQTVASAFDIREGPDRPVTETLINVLREKTLLLILDNCEHLLDACAQLITSLLTHCARLKILTTSREILNIEGEAAYYLPSLSLPEFDVSSLQALSESESVQLFTERAAMVLSSFDLTKENAEAVVEICHKVDGIPLAVELAAARVDILGIKEILKQLHDSFALLMNEGRRTLPRHQTLHASMDWSWGLLSDKEQRFMRQLSVFAGGWTLESAQAVCDGDILNLTSALVKKSLIVVNQQLEGGTRYRFHEIVRQYAHEKLTESGEEVNIRTRHLKYFLQLSEQAEPALRGYKQLEWYACMTTERDNVRAALAWAKKTDVEAGLWISGNLWRFWDDVDMREGERWLRKFLEMPESHHHPPARAKALYAYGIILFLSVQYAPMREVAEECLAIYRALGDQQGEFDGLILSARFLSPINGFVPARGLLQEALALSESLGDIWRQAFATGHLAVADDAYPQRISNFKKAVSLFRKVGDLRELQEYLGLLGNYEMSGGDIESSLKHIREAMQLSQNRYFKGAMHFLSVLGRIESIKGNFQEARTLLEKSIENSEELGFRNLSLWDHAHLGQVLVKQGQFVDSAEIFHEATQGFFKAGNLIGVCYSLEGMAGLFVAANKPAVAARLIGWADALREKISDTRPLLEQANVDQIIAACLAKLGEVAFSDAYERGEKMTLEEAVAYAREENR